MATNIKEAFTEDREGQELFVDTWLNNGVYAPDGTQFSMDDMLATSNARTWMPKVVEEIVREPVEPLFIMERLFTRIPYDPAIRIVYGALGTAMEAEEIPEGGEYPEFSLQVGPGTATVNVGKVGIAVKISEELRRYNKFDVLALHLRRARQAMLRKKEEKGMNYINSLGTDVFDNLSPTTSVFGTCSGRALTGAANGAMTMDNLLKGYSFLMMQGYIPNTILLHPLTWSMWLADPLLRTIVKNTGSGRWFQPVTMGQSTRPWARASQGGRGPASGMSYAPGNNAASEAATTRESLDSNMRGAPTIPDYFPYPLQVVVSPFVPFDVERELADVMLFDSNNLGALFVDEDISTDEWNDPAHDILKVKMRERYGFHLWEDGLAVAVFKSIPVKANEIAFPAVPTISANGSYDELDATTAIVGL